MAGLHRYAAFISYSSKDVTFARRLHRALESYRVPKGLNTAPLTPAAKANRLYPVFIDREELPVGELAPLIRSNLENSSALIVVCSPHSAQSPWVEQEIEYFLSLGRKDRVFAIIASTASLVTEAGADATPDAFPPAFRGDAIEDANALELLAADARKGKDGFHNAKLKVIAGLVGAPLNRLADRDRKRTRRRQFFGAAVSATLIAAALTYWVDYYCPITSYAADYVRRDGVWRELGALNQRAAYARGTSYQFHRNGLLNPPYEVRVVNSRGQCTLDGLGDILGHTLDDNCNAARACSAQFSYQRDGQVTREALVDQYGNTMETLSYTAPSVGQFTEAGFGCSRSPSGIQYVRFTRFSNGPARGYDRRIQFFHQRAPGDVEPRPNRYGEFGVEYERDAAGWPIKVWSLDADGARATNTAGFAGIAYARRSDGLVTLERHVDATGASVSDTNGCAQRAFTYDSNGDMLSDTCLASDGSPSVFVNSGSVRKLYAYASPGQATQERYADARGMPILSRAGYAEVRTLYDAHGYPIANGFFDEHGRPTLDLFGVHLSRVRMGAFGEVNELSFFGIDNQPTLRVSSQEGGNGYHRVTSTFDRHGNRVTQFYYGLDDRPVIEANEGDAGYIKRYDASNHELESVSLGLDHRPLTAAKMGAIDRYTYDDRGNVSSMRFFNADNRPAHPSFAYGAAEERFERDGFGNTLSLTLNGEDGLPMIGTDNWAILRSTWDSRGRRTSQSAFDAGGRPVLDAEGAHETRFVYDFANRVVQTETFGFDGQPVGAQFRATDRFDSRGNNIEEAYFDTTGRPASPIARVEEAFDDRGNNTLRTFWGPDGKPALNEGVAGWRATFDLRGNELSRTFLGLDGRPMPMPGLGYAEVRRSYNVRGLVTSVSYYDAQGQVAFNWALSSPSLHVGFARKDTEYDAFGNEIRDRYFDERGNLVRGVTAEVIFRRDALGRELERRLLDARGNLFLNPISHRAIVRHTYDALGRETSEASFGIHDEPVNAFGGWYLKRTSYDANGDAHTTCETITGIVTRCGNQE